MQCKGASFPTLPSKPADALLGLHRQPASPFFVWLHG